MSVAVLPSRVGSDSQTGSWVAPVVNTEHSLWPRDTLRDSHDAVRPMFDTAHRTSELALINALHRIGVNFPDALEPAATVGVTPLKAACRYVASRRPGHARLPRRWIMLGTLTAGTVDQISSTTNPMTKCTALLMRVGYLDDRRILNTTQVGQTLEQ